MVGTLVTTVGRWRAMAAASDSGVGRSTKSAVVAPTAKGNIRLVPGRVAEEEARDADRDVVPAVADGALGVDLGVEREVAVGVHRGLAAARGARGEEPDGGVVAPRRPGRRAAALVEHAPARERVAQRDGGQRRRARRRPSGSPSTSPPVATSGTSTSARRPAAARRGRDRGGDARDRDHDGGAACTRRGTRGRPRGPRGCPSRRRRRGASVAKKAHAKAGVSCRTMSTRSSRRTPAAARKPASARVRSATSA